MFYASCADTLLMESAATVLLMDMLLRLYTIQDLNETVGRDLKYCVACFTMLWTTSRVVHRFVSLVELKR